MLANSNMRKLADFTILILLFLTCPNCSGDEKAKQNNEMNNTSAIIYVLQDEPKTRLILKKDGNFEYVNIDRKYFPNELYFRTTGKWRKDGEDIFLTSAVDSLEKDSALVSKKNAVDSSYSLFRFYDIYSDSVGFMYVTYPDGQKLSQGSDLRDGIYDWMSDSRKIRTLEFHFVNYESWKYFSDGKNYVVNVYLKPKLKTTIFNDKKFKLNGDTMKSTENFSNFFFIREKNRQ